MDWKREAVGKLKTYAARKGSLRSTAEEIKRIEERMTSIHSASADSVPVHGGTSTREDMLINAISQIDELKRAAEDTKKWVAIVDAALGELSAQERLILDRFYIHRAMGNVDRLCEELHLEKSRVYTLKDAALKHFTVAMYGWTET